MVHVDRHIGFFMGESMNAPDFSLDVLTGSVMPRRLHSRFPSTGRYNANDYVIEVSFALDDASMGCRRRGFASSRTPRVRLCARSE
jgi:hypothetical protein